MLPKPVRAVFYWLLRSGPIGRFVTDIIAWVMYGGVKIFNLPPKQDIAGLTVISHKHQFIFLGIPKVASRSFFNYLVKKHGRDLEIEWYEKRDVFFDLAKQYPDYYKFTFVRNPWSRIVSCYKSKIGEAVIGKRARIHSFYKNLSPNMSFSDFCHWLQTEEGSDEMADRHWISQHCFLINEKDEMICDFVGKYENLDQDWRLVCDKVGLVYEPLAQKGFISAIGENKNPELIENEENQVQKNDYRQYFDEKTKKIIAERYIKDCEMFEYDFDN